jgi:hypothetical protein
VGSDANVNRRLASRPTPLGHWDGVGVASGRVTAQRSHCPPSTHTVSNTRSLRSTVAGGIKRRGERVSLHERIHGAPPQTEAEPPSARVEPPPIRHCWVTGEHGRLPGLLLEGRRTVSGCQGRVIRPVLEDGSWVVVEEWLPASSLEAAE